MTTSGSQSSRSDLAPAQVRALAEALGLPMTAEDVAEVTHRLNGLLDALEPLGTLPLDSVEPVASPLEPDEPR